MDLTFAKPWIVNGTPVNPDGVSIGIYDATAALQVVAGGTPMTNVSAGQYRYVLNTAIADHSYTATIAVSYMGQIFTFTQSKIACGPDGPYGPCAPAAPCREAADLSAAIAENAAGAQSVTSQAGSLSAHSLADQIAADQYLAAKAAVRARGGALGALRPRRMIPPSAVGERIGGGP